MGTWFVIGVKPTIFERTCSNAVEKYSLVDKSYDINIDFQYNQNDPISSKLKSLPQKGWVLGKDKTNSPNWKVSPAWPVKLPYIILEVDEDDHCVIGYPSRDYCWIMSRKPQMDEKKYNGILKTLETKHKYDLKGLRKVPQVWTKEERSKRGLDNEIPDHRLTELN